MRSFVILLSLALASNAAAQSLTVFSSNATKALIPLVFDNSAALRGRIAKGECCDVAVSGPAPEIIFTLRTQPSTPTTVQRSTVPPVVHSGL